MRLFFAMLGTETHTFSPIPTGWSVWPDATLRRRSLERPTRYWPFGESFHKPFNDPTSHSGGGDS